MMALEVGEAYHWQEKVNSAFQLALNQFASKKNAKELSLSKERIYFEYNLPLSSQFSPPVCLQLILLPSLVLSFKKLLTKPLLGVGEQKIIRMVEQRNSKIGQYLSKFCYCAKDKVLGLKCDWSHSNIIPNSHPPLLQKIEAMSSQFQKFLHEIYAIGCRRQSSEKQNPQAALTGILKTLKNYIKTQIRGRKTNYCVPPLQSNDSGETSDSNNSSQRGQKCYSYYENHLRNKIKGQTKKPLLSSILIHEKQPLIWNIEQTNFSLVKLAKVQLQIFKSSINKDVNEAIMEGMEEKKTMTLVEKIPTEKGQKSFNVEVSILKHLRMQGCDNIVNYYIESLAPNCKPKSLFSEYHPDTFESKGNQLSPQKRMDVMKKCAESLSYLKANSFIHRDLKPKNILLDSSANCKLVDFGSAHPLNRLVQRNLVINQPLATSARYNLFHSDLSVEVRNLYEPVLFEEHENYDVYAYGVILEDYLCDLRCQEVFGAFVWQNLIWIRDHTKIEDPVQRLNPWQLTILFKIVQDLFNKWVQQSK